MQTMRIMAGSTHAGTMSCLCVRGRLLAHTLVEKEAEDKEPWRSAAFLCLDAVLLVWLWDGVSHTQQRFPHIS